MFVTPSAVSHQIKTLEDFLGVELFVRYPRKIQLTHAGEDYYAAIQKALMAIDQSTQEIIASHQSGELHLSVAAAFLTRWLLPRLGTFHEQNPDIHLELSVVEGLINFNHQQTDMAVYFGRGDWDDIEIHFLRHYIQVPICSPRLLKKSPVQQPEDLLKHTLLHVTKREDEWPNWFQQVNVPFKESITGVSFSNGSLVAAAAKNGLGIGLADIGFVSEEIQSGQLVIPVNETVQMDKSFYLVYQKNRMMTYAMKTFYHWLMDEMAKDDSHLAVSSKKANG